MNDKSVLRVYTDTDFSFFRQYEQNLAPKLYIPQYSYEKVSKRGYFHEYHILLDSEWCKAYWILYVDNSDIFLFITTVKR